MTSDLKQLCIKTLKSLRKGDLVKHSGMPCFVKGFRKQRTWVLLQLPTDEIIEISKQRLHRLEKKRAEALTAFKASIKGVREGYNTITFSN